MKLKLKSLHIKNMEELKQDITSKMPHDYFKNSLPPSPRACSWCWTAKAI
jgi:hypothetical protein